MKKFVSFGEDFFFRLMDLDLLELRVMSGDGETTPSIFASAMLTVRDLRDNVCSELWLTLHPPRVHATNLKSPRRNKDKQLQQQDEPSLGEMHIQCFAARVSDEEAATRKLGDSVYSGALDLLCKAPFTEAIHLCRTASQTAGDKVASSLVGLLHARGVVLPFIRAVVEQEVSGTASSAVLFRSNSMAIRILSAFGRLAGEAFLRHHLGDLVRQVCSDSTSYEPDPQVVTDAAQSADNIAHIASLTSRFCAQILASEPQFPASFRVICSDVRTIVGKRFEDFWPRAVGGFFFLRFVCPAIASPTTTGLLEPSFNVTKNARRVLILVTKVLQNIANQTTSNEAWMQPLNAIAQEQTPVMEAFLDRVSVDAVEAVREAARHELADQAPKSALAVVGPLEELHDSFAAALVVDDSSSSSSSPFSAELRGAFRQLAQARGVLGGKPFKSVPSYLDSAVVVPTSGHTPFWDSSASGGSGGGGGGSGSSSSSGGGIGSGGGGGIGGGSAAAAPHIMNGALWVAPYRDSELVAFSLANSVTLLIRGALDRGVAEKGFKEGTFLDWQELERSAEFQDFERAMSELHHVRLEPLGAEARIVFWVNVLNCMVFLLHCVSGGKPGKLVADAQFAICGHLFTVDDVAVAVLRGLNTKLVGSKLGAKLFKPDDPRRNFVTQFDPKINFCLVTFGWDSPVMRPYEHQQTGIRRAAQVYCEKWLTTDLAKVEVLVPKLLEDNRLDWPEDDPNQRVLQFVQFVSAKKLEILQTLTNPKCSIVVVKNKNPAHAIYWMSQMRLDEKWRTEEKLRADVVAPTTPKGSTAPVTIAAGAGAAAAVKERTASMSGGGAGGGDQSPRTISEISPRSDASSTSPRLSPGTGAPGESPRPQPPLHSRGSSSPSIGDGQDPAGGRLGWARVQRSSAATTGTSSDPSKLPSLALQKRGPKREVRIRGASVSNIEEEGTSSATGGSPSSPSLAVGLESSGGILRRSPRVSPRLQARHVFDGDSTTTSGRNSGWQEDSAGVATAVAAADHPTLNRSSSGGRSAISSSTGNIRDRSHDSLPSALRGGVGSLAADRLGSSHESLPGKIPPISIATSGSSTPTSSVQSSGQTSPKRGASTPDSSPRPSSQQAQQSPRILDTSSPSPRGESPREPGSPPIPPKPSSPVAGKRVFVRRPGEAPSGNPAFRKSPIVTLTSSGGAPLPPLPPSVVADSAAESSSPAVPKRGPAAGPAGGDALRCDEEAALVEALLKETLVEASAMVDFELSLGTGKVLMAARRLLMQHLGWSEMPSAWTHQLPVVELSPIQKRFVPEGKQATLLKLLQAFHSGSMDIELLLKEILRRDDAAKWAETEPALYSVLKQTQTLLASHMATLCTARDAELSVRSDRQKVLQMEHTLVPQFKEMLATLELQSALLKVPESRTQLTPLLASALALIEAELPAPDGEELQIPPGNLNVEPEVNLAMLIQKFTTMEALFHSPKATTKGITFVALKVQQVKYLFEGVKNKGNPE